MEISFTSHTTSKTEQEGSSIIQSWATTSWQQPLPRNNHFSWPPGYFHYNLPPGNGHLWTPASGHWYSHRNLSTTATCLLISRVPGHLGSDLLMTGRHAWLLSRHDLPRYFMPFSQVLTVQIAQTWYHIKAEKIAYISDRTCIVEILIVFMLEWGTDGQCLLWQATWSLYGGGIPQFLFGITSIYEYYLRSIHGIPNQNEARIYL